jgi:peroxiredoxin
MSMTMKLAAGSPFPAVAMPRLGGGEVAPASGDDWRLFVVYRGRHCPLCKIYLKTLNDLMDEFSAIGVSVMVASGDPEQKAAADLAEHGWRFPVGYAMTMAQMRMLGLYLSEPRSAQETCPSSNHLRLLGALANGVSGPSVVEIKLRFGDASSGVAGWFCA